MQSSDPVKSAEAIKAIEKEIKRSQHKIKYMESVLMPKSVNDST